MTTLEEIKMIRKAIKSKPELKNVMVRNGQGTAYGYVEITGGKEFGNDFTTDERDALKKYFTISAGGNFAIVAPDDRKSFIREYC